MDVLNKIRVIFSQSVKAIWVNKGRSFLTILGIIIGISSVIALTSLGEGVSASITEQISAVGTNNLTVTSGNFDIGGDSERSGDDTPPTGFGQQSASFGPPASTLTIDDLRAIEDKDRNPLLVEISGDLSGTTLFEIDGSQTRTSVNGVSADFFNIFDLKVAEGRIFTNDEVSSSENLVVIGSEIYAQLEGTTNIQQTESNSGSEDQGKAMSPTIFINDIEYTIIGILEKKEESRFVNYNSQIFIPNITAMTTFERNTLDSITAKVVDTDSVEQAKSDIEQTLLDEHGIADIEQADFTVLSSADLLDAVDNITGVLTSLLGGIAGISLIVGGIGIMNIMLVSVTERTREIGLRKALGAKTSDIMLQFVTEAVLLTLIGGLIGIFVGILFGKLVEPSIGFTPIVTTNSIILAVSVSSLVGLLFGIYPAAKAAKMDPIVALRYE